MSVFWGRCLAKTHFSNCSSCLSWRNLFMKMWQTKKISDLITKKHNGPPYRTTDTFLMVDNPANKGVTLSDGFPRNLANLECNCIIPKKWFSKCGRSLFIWKITSHYLMTNAFLSIHSSEWRPNHCWLTERIEEKKNAAAVQLSSLFKPGNNIPTGYSCVDSPQAGNLFS